MLVISSFHREPNRVHGQQQKEKVNLAIFKAWMHACKILTELRSE